MTEQCQYGSSLSLFDLSEQGTAGIRIYTEIKLIFPQPDAVSAAVSMQKKRLPG